jgi:phosphoribosylformylglycinamidine synthase I
MTAQVAIITFPGSNSEEETLRACVDAGIDAQIVLWTATLDAVKKFDAYVLPGGFAYEDRIRAGAVAAHDRLMEAVREGAAKGKLVLGICNGAQILLESGLAPGFDLLAPSEEAEGSAPIRPQAGFTQNQQRAFLCRAVHVKLSVDPNRCAFTTGLKPGTVIPMWAAHGEGRLAARPSYLERIASGSHVVFQYAFPSGTQRPAPNGSALDAAAITNVAGNVLAIMPHAERSAWGFQRVGPERAKLQGDTAAMMAPADGNVLFKAFAAALKTN